jgi:hypothetical protein
MRSRLTLVGAVIGLVLLGGCGSSSDEAEEVAAVAKSFYAAASEGDGRSVCAVLTPSFATAFEERAGGVACSKLFSAALQTEEFKAERSELREHEAEVDADSVAIDGDTATVELSGETLTLKRSDDEWKIDGSGGGTTVIDSEKASSKIKSSIERSLHEAVKSVSCPEDQEVVAGARFHCIVVFTYGERAAITLKVLNAQADIKLLALRTIK